MEKIALRHHLNKIFNKHPKDFEGFNIDAVKIYLDISDAEPILKILRDRKNHNRFKLIIMAILSGTYNESIYKKETGNVTAMRFSGKINSRIYCLETFDGGKKVIMSRGLIHKDSEKNTKEINQLIEVVNNSKFKYHEK